MAEINGTPLKDVVTVKSGDTFHGNEGDDEITLLEGSTGQGNAGNDKIVVAADAKWATVWYWWSPGVIYVDMEAGYALDGYGTRDTLINVHNVHGFQRNGDKGYGTSEADSFYLGSNWQRQPGTVYIDGRAGLDRVSMGYNPSDNFGPVVVSVSVDGRLVKVYNANYPSFIYELHNIERFDVWNNSTQSGQEYDLAALRDLSHAGEEILLRGDKGWQTKAAGTSTTVTYSFMTQTPLAGGEGGTGFIAFTAQQQQIVRDLLSVLQQQTGLSFSEVSGDAGQIRLGVNQQANTRGYSFIPDVYKGDARAGDVWLDVETANVMQPGQEGYYVLLHELGHALGLQHPLPESDTSGATVLLNALATPSNTLMLELSAASTGGTWPTWFGGFDLQALRALYGSRAYATGNDVYKMTDGSNPMNIIDDGGVDTLDVSTVSVSVSIDLHAGASSSIGMDAQGMAKHNNVSVAGGALIENVIGSPYDDVIIGNAANNFVTFTGGNDIVDGDAGLDSVRFWSNANSMRVFKDSATGYWNAEALNNEGGSLELRQVERLVFTDSAWALDTSGVENAGITAKILGAVFGKAALNNKQYVGIGLSFLDAGWTYDNLAGLALNAAGATDNDQIVSLLWKNVIGTTASAADKAPYIGMLENGMPPGALAHLAADTSFNTVNINLVGLMQTGIEYMPV
jgi:serralysin